MKRILVILVFGLLLIGCKSKKRIVTKKKPNKPETEQVSTKSESSNTNEVVASSPVKNSKLNATETYIANYKTIAMIEMRKYKIPASITLAQGILESGSGKGRLAVKANNHFGIKCHGWKGKKIYHDDDASQECFRKYNHAKSSFEDHSKFLTTRRRYSKLFQFKQDDYKSWAKGLRAAGYATDRKYPQKLISLIERYKLYEYDANVLGKPSERIPVKKNKHQVVKGDTLYSLSKRYNISVEDLKRLNKLKNNDLNIGQTLIIKSN
ncbi:glucosaminidase domain-containing protein [Ichthyenterobacterium magnum]|uniref:Peptidoglycan hydrolase n=1 Tax=Ichthyenterobacterium magnum TaxID=1230530 RepID=A0A420DFW4_9FLAO|nr:glucosaminidase domain-containing protein [Ichthyenterobacterium magnum]RKE91995.1 flagellum-specific peptidoglycan hydrolase FlgJ [Ichthyenterobacterium magnum]